MKLMSGFCSSKTKMDGKNSSHRSSSSKESSVEDLVRNINQLPQEQQRVLLKLVRKLDEKNKEKAAWDQVIAVMARLVNKLLQTVTELPPEQRLMFLEYMRKSMEEGKKEVAPALE